MGTVYHTMEDAWWPEAAISDVGSLRSMGGEPVWHQARRRDGDWEGRDAHELGTPRRTQDG